MNEDVAQAILGGMGEAVKEISSDVNDLFIRTDGKQMPFLRRVRREIVQLICADT